MKTIKDKYLISARAVANAIASSLPRIIPQWGNSSGSRNSVENRKRIITF